MNCLTTDKFLREEEVGSNREHPLQDLNEGITSLASHGIPARIHSTTTAVRGGIDLVLLGYTETHIMYVIINE